MLDKARRVRRGVEGVLNPICHPPANLCVYLPTPFSLPLHSNLNLVILAHDGRCPRNNYITGHYHISLKYTTPPLHLSLSLCVLLSLPLLLFLSFHLRLAVAKKIRNLSTNFAKKNLNHLKSILEGMLQGIQQYILQRIVQSILQGIQSILKSILHIILQAILPTRNIAIVILVF